MGNCLFVCLFACFTSLFVPIRVGYLSQTQMCAAFSLRLVWVLLPSTFDDSTINNISTTAH